MGLFGSSGKQVIDESVNDQTWIRQGHQRFESGKSRHFGSPETMRDGGDEAASRGDIAAASYYYAKAIDIAQTWANSKPGERPIELDMKLFDAYTTTLESIRSARPGADVVSDWNNENACYALPMMVSITRIYSGHGRPAPVLDQYVNRVVAATGLVINY